MSNIYIPYLISISTKLYYKNIIKTEKLYFNDLYN